ncbi:MAG: TetR/AcrR family transcriptional regulator [Myxococcales bacterium]|jgi:AcrR family transcriptional regulator|nr:TetR/AcrR family transcriptional regulator [Myxococcales bacterium]
MLLEAGVDILREKGITGISVRQVCERAGVNLGMFSYHFHSKENFLRQLLTQAYEDFFQQIVGAAKDVENPLERLLSVLDSAIDYIDSNRALAHALFKDGVRGTPLVAEMVSNNFPRHLKVIFQLVRDSQKSGILRDDIPATQILITLGSALVLPMFWSRELFECLDPKGQFLDIQARDDLNSSNVARARLGIILDGLRPKDASGGPLPFIKKKVSSEFSKLASRFGLFADEDSSTHGK